MKLYGTTERYNLWWTGPPNQDNPRPLYNITPKGEPPPATGYFSREWIEKMKGVNFDHCERVRQ